MVTVYTPETACANCAATKRALEKKNIPYTVEVLGEEHPQREEFRAEGFTAFPVVVTDAGSWCGFRPDKILQLTGAD